MEILKYLDILIGLAVVMVLLSPMVSGITQMVLWVSKVRPVRLRLALATLIKELNGEAFDFYDAAKITNLAPNSAVIFRQPNPLSPITKTASGAGEVLLEENVGVMLAAGNGDLLSALTLPPGATPIIMLRPRGTKDLSFTSRPTNANGETVVEYKHDGPSQLASRRFTATVNRAGTTVAGATVTAAIIDSGTFKGTALQRAGAVCTYPDTVRPIPASHDLKLTVTGGNAGDVVTVSFEGDRTMDHANPVPGAAGLLEDEAKALAADVLKHPMIGKPSSKLGWLRFLDVLKWGEVVQREELIRILLGFASTNERLRGLLQQNGIPDAQKALSDIRDVAQRLEAEKPEVASHARLTQAILEAARSDFVGRINNWFDQIMDRTTAEYKFRAQLVTVVAAFIVASTVQMDSIELLRRLSTDDKLRDSLVQQAQLQQDRLTQQENQTPKDRDQQEIQLAKSRRDEIEDNLVKLRDPQLAVLPDHFIWQPLPRARLMRNPAWKGPYSPRMELVTGSGIFSIAPQWKSDPLANIEDAVRNGSVPLTLSREQVKQYTVASTEEGLDVGSLRVQVKQGEGLADVLQHDPAGKSASFDGLLNAPQCVAQDNKRNATIANCTAESLQKALNSRGFKVVDTLLDHLVLTSHRLGTLQLRSEPGKPESNILNRAQEWSSSGPIGFDKDLFSQSWRGILLTWILLSLGAPFWYDALKDLLKLRSSVAKKEEDARKERQTTVSTTAKAT